MSPAITNGPSDSETVRLPRLFLCVKGGEQTAVTDQVVIGRDPVPSELGLDTASVLRLSMTDELASRNHALVAATGSRILQFDLESTNGTEVVRAGRSSRVEPGVEHRIEVGAVLHVGQSVIELEFG